MAQSGSVVMPEQAPKNYDVVQTTERPRPIESDAEYEVLEKEARLSQSILWPLLEEYYTTESVSAFDVIPSYMTSNPYIAETYAEQMVAFLLDIRSKLNYDEPLYVVEMASGAGKFSFYLIKELVRKLAYYDDLKTLKLRYVITDFAEGNVTAWEESEGFRRYIDQGVLDFAIFRPEDQTELHLKFSGEVVNANTVKNPVMAIANYFFDSIRMDLFRIDSGQLQEIRKTFFKKRNPEKESRWLMAHIEHYETYHPVSVDGYYQNERLNDLLRQYMAEMPNATILFPISVFKVIDNLMTMSGNNLYLISSDKGFCYREFMRDHWEVDYSMHGDGAFSFMVNFEATKRYIELLNGHNWNTSSSNYFLATSVNAVLPWKEVKYEQTNFVFQEKVEKQSLTHNLFFAREFISEEAHKSPDTMLTAAMGLLELSNYDPDIYWSVLDKVLTGVYTMSWRQHSKLIKILDNVLDNYYAVRKRFDLYVWTGRIFYEINEFKRCAAAMTRSLEEFGPNGPAYYHLAACYEVMGDHQQALENYQYALPLAPECELTKSGIERTTQALANAR